MQKNGFLCAHILLAFSEANDRVKVDAVKVIPYTIAQVLGLTQATVSETASAKKVVTSNGPGFVLYSGNALAKSITKSH